MKEGRFLMTVLSRLTYVLLVNLYIWIPAVRPIDSHKHCNNGYTIKTYLSSS